MRWPSDARRAAAAVAASAAFLAAYQLLFGRYLPTARGTLGQDYEYFLPRLTAGQFFHLQNGWFAVPWFTPFACGGVPAFANPQDLWFSVPQWLSFYMDPLRAVQTTLLLFALAGAVGTFVLLRRRFQLAWPAALLGAALYGFNGFFAYRMAIGHLTAHAFMLLPGIAALLVGGASRRELARVLIAGLLLGYVILTSAQFLPPFVLALVALCLLHVVVRGAGTRVAARAAIAGALALALSASHVSAVLHFLHQFPRTDYPLPGIPSVARVVGVALRLLFVSASAVRAGAGAANGHWAVERHELEYGVTLVPAVILLAAAVRGVARRRAVLPTLRWMPLAAFVLLLLVPLAVNVYQPWWNALLKSLPLIGSTSTFLRWFCVYVPVACVGAAVATDSLVSEPRTRWLVFACTAVAVPLFILGGDDAFYERQGFDPRPLLAGDRAVLRTGNVPAVDSVVAYDPAAIVRCASTALCYEPIFGYRLERLPRPALAIGPVFTRDSLLNIRNPSCYVFPTENGCRPGARFRADQRAEAASFVRYEPFPFRRSRLQRAADWITGAALLVCVAAVVGALARAAVAARAGTA